MVTLFVFFVGLFGGFILGKRHGAKVEREILEAEANAKQAAANIKKRATAVKDALK